MSIHGVGVDVGSVPRVAALIDRYGERFVSRWFADCELVDAHAGACRVASRFSAKEAVWKALRIDERTPVPWRQIVITSCGDRLTVRLDGELAGTAAALGVGPLTVSATVCGDVAFAIAIAEKAEAQ
ncbi:MAG TPA: 4'-phosphopantetheinyl transferase superfamily protein [Propionibacteriaceae bacterium]|nr:4'-phosphopantetheinyl transferase superfamily protein [Propionibacteriaceae bacterium]